MDNGFTFKRINENKSIKEKKRFSWTLRIYSLIQFKGYNSIFKFFDGVQFRKYFIS